MQAQIEELLVERRFDPTIAPQLEAYVDEQVKQGKPDVDSNLALLRFYQYQSATAKPAVVAKILLLALVDLPEPSFMLCLHLIPVNLPKDASIDALKAMAEKLETCHFKAFWADCAQQQALVASVPGFADKVREYVAFVVSATYQVVSRAELEGALNLKGGELDALMGKKGWKAEGADVSIGLSSLNSSSAKVKQEGLPFEELAPIVVSTSI